MARPVLARRDLVDLNVFVAVARIGSFGKAASELGLSTSAVSHAIRNLETRLGVAVLNRTSRSVVLTAFGEQLFARLSDHFDGIGDALEEVNAHRDKPVGHLRINVLRDAARLLLAPTLPAYTEACPDMQVEVTVDDAMIDIVGAGYDAGIRFGGAVPQDMIAQRLTPDLQWVAAASPGYLDRRGRPLHPRELKDHDCIRLRMGNAQVYKWEFARDDESFALDVPGKLLVNETGLAIDMALGGAGIVYCLKANIVGHLQSGALKAIVVDWCPPGPGFHIYYSGRRNVTAGLRVLIDILRAAKIAE